VLAQVTVMVQEGAEVTTHSSEHVASKPEVIMDDDDGKWLKIIDLDTAMRVQDEDDDQLNAERRIG
jgi:hypothetical protein